MSVDMAGLDVWKGDDSLIVPEKLVLKLERKGTEVGRAATPPPTQDCSSTPSQRRLRAEGWGCLVKRSLPAHLESGAASGQCGARLRRGPSPGGTKAAPGCASASLTLTLPVSVAICAPSSCGWLSLGPPSGGVSLGV